MNYATSFKTAAALASLALFASCGGGDDAEAGGPMDFQVQPTQFTREVDATATTCSVDAGGSVWFTIVGGAGPYLIQSSSDGVVPSPAKLEKPNEQFTVAFNGRCVDPATVTITDANKQSVFITVTNKRKEAAAS